MLSLRVIRRSLHIDKIHKNNNSNFVIKVLFLLTLLHVFGAGGRKLVMIFMLMEFIKVKNFFFIQLNCSK